jgi:hypothetical protein
MTFFCVNCFAELAPTLKMGTPESGRTWTPWSMSHTRAHLICWANCVGIGSWINSD